MGHHALRQFPNLAGAVDGGLRQKAFRLRAIESRMHAGDVIERLRNLDPARQHGDIGDEADIAHELIALGPGIASEHLQLSLVRGEAENRVERGGLAGAVGTDESEDAALFHAQIDAVQRDWLCRTPCGGRVLLCMPWLQRSSSADLTCGFDFAASSGWPLAPFSSSSGFSPSR